MGRLRCVSCIILIICVPIGILAFVFGLRPVHYLPTPPRYEFISFGVVLVGGSLLLRFTRGSEEPLAVDYPQSELSTTHFDFTDPENTLRE